MRTIILRLHYHQASQAKAWLESLPGSGTAYLTDILAVPQPEGGRTWCFPGDRRDWQELARPGDLETAELAAIAGADVLYKYPSVKRRRLFVRYPPDKI